MFESLKNLLGISPCPNSVPIKEEPPKPTSDIPKPVPKVDKSQPYEGLYFLQNQESEQPNVPEPRKFKVLLNLNKNNN